MLSKSGDVIKIDTTGRQTTRPSVSKMADRRYHVASISRQFRGPIYWNRMRGDHLSMRTEGIKAFSKRIRRCSVDVRKRYENYKCGRKSFWKRRKTAPFSFENGLVWTGPKPIDAAEDKLSELDPNKRLNPFMQPTINTCKLLKTLKGFITFFYTLLTYVVSLNSWSTNLPKRAVLLRSW